jgi:hypothetical protein
VVGAIPAWRLRLRVRPVFRFPPGVARRAGGLALAGLAAGAAGAVVGAGICLAIPDTGKLLDAAMAVVAAAFSVITFGAVAYALDRGDLKTVVTRLRRGRRPPPPAAEEP